MNELELLRSIDYGVLGIYLMMCLFALASLWTLFGIRAELRKLNQDQDKEAKKEQR